jgi:hypothetical protein
MSVRIVAVIAALAFAPTVAFAQEAQAAAPASIDPAVLEGKIDALAEQYAETKNDVSSLKRLKISGYMQARYGWSEAANFNTSEQGTAAVVKTTSNTAAPSNQGFFIRRGRFKAVYDADQSAYVVQIDIIPAGVTIKEGYATLKLPQGFAIDAGLQLFPFGYEVASRSSSDLDTLERSAVTRALLDGEYDLGVALRGKLSIVDFKIGLFNGNGIKGNSLGIDNDPLKDVIGRATVDLGILTAGVSGWYGKTRNFMRDNDKVYDRTRFAVDAQLFLDLLPIGGTALKGEWMVGTNAIGGTLGVGAGTPGGTPGGAAAAGVPPTGHGFYLILTQNLGSQFQVAAKYEQYVPNNTLAASPTAIKRQDEIQLAGHWYVGQNYKFSASWYHPTNAELGATAVADPKKDQVFLQAQAKF